MTENSALDILKNAILLEKRGKAFYRTAAQNSTHADVKAFFETMAAEEVPHVKILSDQYKAFKENGAFAAPDTSQTGAVAQKVLTPEVKDRIAAADFEAAAISAAECRDLVNGATAVQIAAINSDAEISAPYSNTKSPSAAPCSSSSFPSS